MHHRAKDTIEIREVDPRDADAISCLTAYYTELAERLSQGFEVELSRDPDAADLIRPRGAFWVAGPVGAPVGCVGLTGHGGESAEIKRLWIARDARRSGLALRLMTQAEDVARELGIRTLQLDTNSALPEASAFYRKHGWQEIDRFNDDPYAEQFFEKRL